MKLYEISHARDILDEFFAESEGEITPELEALLAELDGQADEKIERVALYIREKLSIAAAVKEEAQRLAGIQKRNEKAAESLKAYLHREMERLGKTKVNGLLCTVAIQNNAPSVVGELDQDALRAMYECYLFDDALRLVRFTPESFALDKHAVIAADKLGHALPDGLSVTQTQSLRIR